MTTGASCTVGVLHERDREWALPRARSRCGDCGVARGGLHHPGCDLQRCPRCRGQLISCGCRFDDEVFDDGFDDDEVDDEALIPDRVGAMYFDGNGVLTEHRWIAGQEVVIHDDDVPDSDRTVVDGIPCTTALRTVIDIAPDLGAVEFHRVVRDCLDRRLFTVEEGLARIARADMQGRRGAELLRLHLLGSG